MDKIELAADVREELKRTVEQARAYRNKKLKELTLITFGALTFGLGISYWTGNLSWIIFLAAFTLGLLMFLVFLLAWYLAGRQINKMEKDLVVRDQFISGQMSHRKQRLSIPVDWEIKRNEFYDIDPFGNSSVDEKEVLIFAQEDMLWIKKGNYNIDLGWYGGDKLNDIRIGFYLYLYRGDNWNKCELLEKFRSKNKNEIVDNLSTMIASVDKGDYNLLTGYKIDEADLTNENSMSDHEIYSAKK